jgi:hypothetical protein
MPAAARGAARRACLAPRGAGAWHRGDGASPRGRRHARARGSAAQWPSAPCRVELQIVCQGTCYAPRKKIKVLVVLRYILKMPTRCFSDPFHKILMMMMTRGARSNQNNMHRFHGNTKIWYPLPVKRLLKVGYLSQGRVRGAQKSALTRAFQ